MADKSQGKGDVGAGGVAGAAAGAKVAGIENEQTNNQRGLTGATQAGPAVVDAVGGTAGAAGSITTGAEKQVGSVGKTDPNNEETGTRNTPTGETKDTAKVGGAPDDPYAPGPRHVDLSDKNAPTTLRARNAEAQVGDQGRSDYSFGAKPPRYPNESNGAYEARIEQLKESDRLRNMGADERMREAGTHPDDLGEGATEEEKTRAQKMLAYEQTKDGVRGMVTHITERLGTGPAASRAISLLDDAMAALREHIG